MQINMRPDARGGGRAGRRLRGRRLGGDRGRRILDPCYRASQCDVPPGKWCRGLRLRQPVRTAAHDLSRHGTADSQHRRATCKTRAWGREEGGGRRFAHEMSTLAEAGRGPLSGIDHAIHLARVRTVPRNEHRDFDGVSMSCEIWMGRTCRAFGVPEPPCRKPNPVTAGSRKKR